MMAWIMRNEGSKNRSEGLRTSLSERYKEIFSMKFEGIEKPNEAKDWMRVVGRVLGTMGVTDK